MHIASRRITLAGLALALTLPAAGSGQETDPRAQIEELKQGQAEIRRELREIRALLQRRQAPPQPARPAGPDVAGKVFGLGDNPSKGASDATLVLVEFTDYQ